MVTKAFVSPSCGASREQTVEANNGFEICNTFTSLGYLFCPHHEKCFLRSRSLGASARKYIIISSTTCSPRELNYQICAALNGLLVDTMSAQPSTSRTVLRRKMREELEVTYRSEFSFQTSSMIRISWVKEWANETGKI